MEILVKCDCYMHCGGEPNTVGLFIINKVATYYNAKSEKIREDFFCTKYRNTIRDLMLAGF